MLVYNWLLAAICLLQQLTVWCCFSHFCFFLGFLYLLNKCAIRVQCFPDCHWFAVFRSEIFTIIVFIRWVFIMCLFLCVVLAVMFSILFHRFNKAMLFRPFGVIFRHTFVRHERMKLRPRQGYNLINFFAWKKESYSGVLFSLMPNSCIYMNVLK